MDAFSEKLFQGGLFTGGLFLDTKKNICKYGYIFVNICKYFKMIQKIDNNI